MSIPISQLVTGVVNGEVEIPGTNPLDTTSSLNGTTFKYLVSDILQYILSAQGFTTYQSCIAASTIALTATYDNGTAGVGATLTNAGAQAALTLDGVTLALNDRVLIKNQVSTAENGIYVVTNVGSASTNWVLTRATDYDQASEIIYLGIVLINQGASQKGIIYQEMSQGPFVIGTSPITFQALTIDVSLLPSASPANKLLRSDGTYWVQSTNASLSATDALTQLSELGVDNISINGNTIASTDTNGNLILTPNGTGDLVLDGLKWPQADGTNGQAITTNGAGQLGWTSFGAPYTPAALTEVNDTNVTMTLGGTPATALLQAVSMTLGWTGQLGISRGGTNASTIGASGTLAQSDGSKYTFTTATYPSTATATGTILRANGTNWLATTATYPNTTSINHILYSSAANVIGEIADAIGGVLVSNNTGVPSMLANPADNYRVLQSKNAAIPEWSVAAYPHTAGASGTLMQSDGTDWTNTQATYPGSTNKNHILYSSANNTVGEIATQKNAVLVSDNQSTPQWSGSLSDGQIIIGKTNDLPAAASITGSGSITVTPGANSITISSSASGQVNAGTANELAYYATTGSAVSGLSTANSATLVTSSTGVPSWTSSMTNGQILIGSTGATPVPATLTAGPGVSIANAAGSITISGTGSGIGWTEVTGTSQAMSADNGYVSSNAGLVTLTLPTTAAFGTSISIVGKGAGGWKIAQNAGQNIQLGSSSSTVGVAGYIASTNQFDSIDLLCTTANTTWTVQGGPQGNITVA